uniref:Uncharacterized protein n=1 Tax=Phenylobacterium glaciei TaxID=2803784 RepID=A0A974P165_9CAUL|nr:hypothetical protein JKL49_17600 [Phenylobacterium glaciei]
MGASCWRAVMADFAERGSGPRRRACRPGTPSGRPTIGPWRPAWRRRSP